MVALLKQWFGLRSSEDESAQPEKPIHDISQDQINYAHELAEERRRAWAAAKKK